MNVGFDPWVSWQGINDGVCEHSQWNRMVVDWERCDGVATQTVHDDEGLPLRVCDEDAPLYRMGLTPG